MNNLFATGLVAAASLAIIAAPADAFTFTTNFEGEDPKGDIWLQSIELEDGTIIEEFSFISSARIVANDEYTGGNSGAASADIGDNATTGIKVEDAAPEDLVENLNNNNLNNIIDTEDRGAFQLDFFFDGDIDNLLVWERGRNSALAVQALDVNGELVGDRVVVDFRQLNGGDYSAGYSIDTQEIGGSQPVGAFGLTMADLLGPDLTATAIDGFRFFSDGSSFNGPDWKIAGTKADREGGPEVIILPNEDPTEVPEPGTILGLMAIGGVIAASRRR